MPENGLPPSPATTLVVILGASDWPDMPALHKSGGFTSSAEGIRKYFLSQFKLPYENLLWLFDAKEDPNSLDKRISDFLKKRIKDLQSSSNPARDLVVYYTGHGEFDNSKEYYLAIQSTRKDNPLVSSIQVKNLATTLQEARFLRRYIIVDSCFAGASESAFQSSSDPEEDAKRAFEQTKESFSNQNEGGSKKQRTGLPSRGTALLFSSSRKKRSFLAPDEKFTMFTEALLYILSHDSTSGGRLSLHIITVLVRNYINENYAKENDVAMPIDDSPDQDEGDIADVPFFPTIATWPNKVDRFEPKDGVIQCYVVLSEANRERKEEESLVSIVESALQYYSQDIEKLTMQGIEEKPYAINIGQIISSKEEYKHAIKALCYAEIAIFDVTNFEPAIMLMLGIRSVVRRGITIVSVGGGQTPDKHFEAPFNIKETSIVFCSAEQFPYQVIGKRLLNGFEQLRNLPHYLDLPSFEAVRNIPPDFASEKREHYSKQALVLCPFGDKYSDNNWNKRLKQHLPTIKELRDAPLIRSLDMESPRLVSQTLYEAIRFTRRCFIDWTWWRPNVFFEMGVRLAVSDINPICIIERRHFDLIAAMADERQDAGLLEVVLEDSQLRLKNCIYQCNRLLMLFDPIPYQTFGDADRDAYRRMITRYNEDLKNTSGRDEDQERLEPDFTFKVVTESIDWQVELAAKSVYDELIDSAVMLSVRELETKGRWSILYPENNELKQKAQESAEERYLAAWFYIDRRYEEKELLENSDLTKQYIALGSRSATYLLESPRAADNRKAMEIFEKVEMFQEKVEKLKK